MSQDAFVAQFYLLPFTALITFSPIWAPELAFRRCAPINYERNGFAKLSITDWFILTVQLACGLVLVSLLQNELQPRAIRFLQFVVSFFLLVSWYRCLLFMDRRDIRQQAARILVQLVFYPLSILLISAITNAVIFCLISLEAGNILLTLSIVAVGVAANLGLIPLRAGFSRWACPRA